MQDGVKLERKTKEELKQIAQGLDIQRAYALKKDELIAAIREARAKKEAEERKRQMTQQPRRKERPADVSEVTGILDVMNDGFGFLRVEGLSSSPGDVYVAPTQIRRFGLKTGDEITGDARPPQEEGKYSPLLYVKKINGDVLDVALKRRPFEKLTPIYPTERLRLEGEGGLTGRMIDFVAPVGKGQRGLIVAPPKAGKTTIIKSVAQAITKNNPEVNLMVLLIDERPEEVTDMKRSINRPVYFSTFDQMPENHCKVAEMVLARAMRLVEQKKDVVILMDSITRLARAYNLTVTPTGRTLSGGLDPDALHGPKKFFGAARNIEEGGSLTILATALVETGSRMDDVIFEEFKGTGNMELKLDRQLQEKRIFPAIDISKSGTRREEDLLDETELEAARLVRRVLSGSGVQEMTSRVLNYMKHTKTNRELAELIMSNYGKKN